MADPTDVKDSTMPPFAKSYGDSTRWRKMPFSISLPTTFNNWHEMLAFTLGKSTVVNQNIVGVENNPDVVQPETIDQYINESISVGQHEDDNKSDVAEDEQFIIEAKGEKNPYKVSIDRLIANIGLNHHDGNRTSMRTFFGSSELGYNDTINCLFQFNHDDDIAHLTTTFYESDDQNSAKIGRSYHVLEPHWISMGRVYLETFHNTQAIMWIQAGIPVYNNMLNFYVQAYDNDVGETVNSGVGGIFEKLIDAAKFVVNFPFTVFKVVKFIFVDSFAMIKDFLKNTTISKYYEFSTQMHLYYSYVNSLLIHLAVNMRIIKNEGQTTDGQTGEKTVIDKTALPRLLQEDFDIFTIMQKRAIARGLKHHTVVNSTISAVFTKVKSIASKIAGWFETAIKSEKNTAAIEKNTVNEAELKAGVIPNQPDNKNEAEDTSAASMSGGFFQTVLDNALGIAAYVGFKIDSTSSSSESFSNSTDKPEIASTLDSLASSGLERRAKFMGGNVMGSSVLSAIGQLAINAVDWVSDTLSSMTGASAVSMVVKGKGFFDIPEIWKASSFSKSYSFDMELRAPYGDPITVFTSIYVPCMMILALSLPRSVGRNTYTSPFLVQAYCKGQFAVPCGIIEQVSITRGASEHGWTYSWLPTKLSLSFSIKDLSPVLHIGLSSSILSLLQIFTTNSSLQEYLLTLAGIGLAERRGSMWVNIRRKIRIITKITAARLLNPAFWSSYLGNSSIPLIIGAISPYSLLSDK
jgi:hypothetical protein